MPAHTAAPTDLEPLEMLLAMSEKEAELFARLYDATASILSSNATREQKRVEIGRLIAEDPGLRVTFEALRQCMGPSRAGATARPR